MKKLAILCVGILLLGSTACTGPTRLKDDWGATLAYSSHERYTMIGRNWDIEGKEAMDDIDSLLLLRPASALTIWSVHQPSP